jgi:hypothetical protein
MTLIASDRISAQSHSDRRPFSLMSEQEIDAASDVELDPCAAYEV